MYFDKNNRPIYPDPGISVGPLRILERTDGLFAVHDDRRELGDMSVGTAPTVEAATSLAERLWTNEKKENENG